MSAALTRLACSGRRERARAETAQIAVHLTLERAAAERALSHFADPAGFRSVAAAFADPAEAAARLRRRVRCLGAALSEARARVAAARGTDHPESTTGGDAP